MWAIQYLWKSCSFKLIFYSPYLPWSFVGPEHRRLGNPPFGLNRLGTVEKLWHGLLALLQMTTTSAQLMIVDYLMISYCRGLFIYIILLPIITYNNYLLLPIITYNYLYLPIITYNYLQLPIIIGVFFEDQLPSCDPSWQADQTAGWRFGGFYPKSSKSYLVLW
jgi:hypothetical protein